MATSSAKTVDQYLDEQPPERREALATVRQAILDNLPDGYEETMQYGMISYIIPFERYPITYNKQPLALASLGAQKNYMTLYLMNVYGDPEIERWFHDAYKASGKKLDMGKSCVRFKKLDDLAVNVVGEAIARTPVDAFIRRYEEARKLTKKGK
jgi:hypothetical protein